MKNNLVKAVASITAATTLLFTTATCFASEAKTVTTYAEGQISVKSTVTADKDAMVTYLASVDGSVESKDEIVYITQWTSTGEEKVISYTLKEEHTKIGSMSATVKYGSDNADVATALNEADTTNTVQVNKVAVTYDAGVATVSEGYVAVDGAAAITITLTEGYELDVVTVNDTPVEAVGLTFNVPYAAEPTLAITTKLTKAPVAAEEAAELPESIVITDATGKTVPSVGKVVKLANVDETVTEYGIYVANAEGIAFKFDDEDTYNGYYPSAKANEDGYYAVNIASELLEDGGYVAYPYYKIGDEYTVLK